MEERMPPPSVSSPLQRLMYVRAEEAPAVLWAMLYVIAREPGAAGRRKPA